MKWMSGRAARFVAVAIAVTILGGCADIAHTPDHVSTIVDREAAAKASPLQNLGVVCINDGGFTLGTRPHDAALVANGNDYLKTLMPAILARVPARFAREGVHAEAVSYPRGRHAAQERALALASYDYVIEFAPVSVALQKNTTDPSLDLSVRVLNRAHQPIWVARVELRTDALPADRRDIREWRGAMADDLAGLLLQQLVTDGFVIPPAR